MNLGQTLSPHSSIVSANVNLTNSKSKDKRNLMVAHKNSQEENDKNYAAKNNLKLFLKSNPEKFFNKRAEKIKSYNPLQSASIYEGFIKLFFI